MTKDLSAQIQTIFLVYYHRWKENQVLHLVTPLQYLEQEGEEVLHVVSTKFPRQLNNFYKDSSQASETDTIDVCDQTLIQQSLSEVFG